MRLWMRLASVMAILAVLPVVGVGLSAIDVATRRAQEASEERLRREASGRADLLGRWIHDQARLVLNWPQLLGGDRLKELSPAAQASFPVAVYRGTPSAVVVVLVDGDGRAVVDPVYRTTGGDRTPADARRAQALIDRLPLTAVLSGPEVVHMGDGWLPGGPGTRPSFPLAVLAAGGQDPAEMRVLGVEVALEPAEDLLASVTAEHAVAVLDAAGVPLVGGEHPLLAPDRLRPLLAPDQRVDFRLEGDAGEVYGSLVPIPSTPGWSLVVAEPAAVVLRPAAEIRARVVLSIGVAALLAVGVALATAGSLSRPVERLRDAADRIARGAVGARAGLSRSDEIGQLGRAFDHMAERLEANRAEIDRQREAIEAFNQELQQRVEERTRELADAQEELVRTGQLAVVAELGAGLAHELNNPLASVLGLAQLLRARHPDEPLLADLESQADRCREVVGTLVRVSTLRLDPSDAPVVRLSVVLREVLELVGGPFRQRGVRLDAPEVDPALQVRADPMHAGRILAQLLDALRAGLDRGGAVTLTAAAAEGGVRVVLEPDRAVAEHPDRRDDWMASAHGTWVAAQLLDRLGGRLEPLDEGRRGWRVWLPGP